MKLSEAIVLGLEMTKFDPSVYLSTHDKCGCLLGTAWTAVRGFKREDSSFVEQAATEWPWIMQEYPIPSGLIFADKSKAAFSILSAFADGIQVGKFTFEDALAWIRSVEPTEPTQNPLLGRHKDFPDPNAERNAGNKDLVENIQGEAAPEDSLGDHEDIVG